MKPFDLEAAKMGAAVCTRDGRQARIICFDAYFGTKFSIVALVTRPEDGEEMIESYNEEGRALGSIETPNDLMMAAIKRKGWMNIYPTNMFMDKHAIVDTGLIYDTIDAAKAQCRCDTPCIATIKVQWEE